MVAHWLNVGLASLGPLVRIQAATFIFFFHFFQTLRAKKGHTRKSLQNQTLTIELPVVQRPFWYV